MSTSWYSWQGEDLILRCHLQPKASRDEISGLHGDSVKIRIAAPPIEGRANAALVKFLAKTFGVAKRDVSIISGELGRRNGYVSMHLPPCRTGSSFHRTNQGHDVVYSQVSHALPSVALRHVMLEMRRAKAPPRPFLHPEKREPPCLL